MFMQTPVPPLSILVHSTIRFYPWEKPVDDTELDSLRFLSAEMGITTSPCFGVLFVDLPVNAAQAMGDPLPGLKALVERYSERRQLVHAIRLSVDGKVYFTVFVPRKELFPR